MNIQPCMEELIFCHHNGNARPLAQVIVIFDDGMLGYELEVNIEPDTYELMSAVDADVLDKYMEAINHRAMVLNALCETVNGMLWSTMDLDDMMTTDEYHTWSYHAMMWLLTSTPNDVLRMNKIEILDADTERRTVVLGRSDWPNLNPNDLGL